MRLLILQFHDFNFRLKKTVSLDHLGIFSCKQDVQFDQITHTYIFISTSTNQSILNFLFQSLKLDNQFFLSSPIFWP